MPVYSVKLRDKPNDPPRIVRASSAARARDHVAKAEALNADQLAELVEKGSKIETASESDPADNDPPPHSDPEPNADPKAD